jgi:4-amino-4-deoxy-L-arabinose transferase-like glycosyltransferase
MPKMPKKPGQYLITLLLESMKKNKLVLLISILVFAFLIRIINIDKNPNGFFCDEASIGYNAYLVLKTGKDEFEKKLPIFFKAFGEYKSPVMIYSTIPFVKIFGLNIFSIRLPAIVYGLISIIAIYLLLNLIFDVNTALYGALIFSILPWHFHFSRFNFELMPYIAFALLGLYYWFLYLKNIKIKSLSLSLLFFALSLYSYFPARIIIPLFSLTLFIIYFKKIKKIHLIFIFIFTSILVLPLLIHTLFGGGMSRWYQVNGQVNIEKIIKKYPQYYSFTYLFVKGDIDTPGQFITRHSVRGIGELYYFQLPLILIGIFYLFKKNRHFFYLMLIALLIYPLADIFTNSISPQATRTIFAIIPTTILSAVGLKQLLQSIKSSFFRILIFVILFFSFINFWKLFQKYPLYSSDFWGWQSGPQEIMSYYLTQTKNYDQLCIEGAFNGSYIFTKFFDPQNICRDKCQICDTKIFDPNKRQIFAVTKNYVYDSNIFNIKKTIYYPNLEIAFYIISKNNQNETK